ncbi:flagellar basal body rod protein FlgB [Actinomadura hibisca]|uniref:flagellar basal body rod protein FlgB n=1 Tax=Actinomadura hibisca TaxID=68565 RepID=UPI00082D5E37|nr:flagellar basal body protein [Actinomadura hibisca]
MFDDVTTSALRVGLTGLAQRQRVTADNIANVETPGFLAGRVEFEDALSKSLGDGDPGAAQPTVARSLEPTRTNGNNVNLDHETLTQMDTGLRYQALLRAMDAKFGQLRDVIKGGA